VAAHGDTLGGWDIGRLAPILPCRLVEGEWGGREGRRMTKVKERMLKEFRKRNARNWLHRRERGWLQFNSVLLRPLHDLPDKSWGCILERLAHELSNIALTEQLCGNCRIEITVAFDKKPEHIRESVKPFDPWQSKGP